MPNLTIGTGALLIVLGLVGYFPVQAVSWTALIPTILGVPFLASGILARREELRMHAMHAAATLGLVGAIVAIVGLTINIFGPGNVVAGTFQSIAVIVCAAFEVLCVRSFIHARRAREAATEQ
jgi:FtsH-binding integral membrane protein